MFFHVGCSSFQLLTACLQKGKTDKRSSIATNASLRTALKLFVVTTLHGEIDTCAILIREKRLSNRALGSNWSTTSPRKLGRYLSYQVIKLYLTVVYIPALFLWGELPQWTRLRIRITCLERIKILISQENIWFKNNLQRQQLES